jgi:CAS/CSE protein, C-terminus
MDCSLLLNKLTKEFAMKGIVQALVMADGNILPVYGVFLDCLTNLVKCIMKNPCNPILAIACLT